MGTLKMNFVRILVLLCWISFSLCSILSYTRLVPGYTKFSYLNPQGVSQTLTFRGFTISGNLVLEDTAQLQSGENPLMIFEKPNLRAGTAAPFNERYKPWYKLNLIEETQGMNYNPTSNPDQFLLSIESNLVIFGPNAVIISCTGGNTDYPCSSPTILDVLDRIILRGATLNSDANLSANEAITMPTLFDRLSNPPETEDYYPVSIVGGGVRDYLTNQIAKINDIDAAIAEDYVQVAYQLKDLFVDWNNPIDSSVLDQRGIRKEQFPDRADELGCEDTELDELCYGDGLDIGPFKAGTPIFPSSYVSYNGKEIKLSQDEAKNHYLYAYSYDLDSTTRDFTFNSVYYDYLAQTFIDPTGKGISDSRNDILRIADDLTSADSSGENWSKDLGGWFRFWRFVAPRDVPNPAPDAKGYQCDPETVAQKHVCGNLIESMCALIQDGYDHTTGYNPYSFFVKLRKKRKFEDSVDGVLNSMQSLMQSD